MADVDPEVATAAQPMKRTFKKFSFRGVDLDALLDSLLMSLSSSSLHMLAEDMQEGEVVGREDDGSDLAGQVSQVGGFSDGTLSFEGFSSATSSSSSIGDG
ncbi:hypothetical protein LWI29_025327 [Acer saccharum]|uniref:Uncharacterized protein n=1 Tax=Acer saccharum TaxID=4024 RepID=A0AA39TJG1_ACESA|nr:hypothetical protein LWI29_025327 [Acer saccharum]